MQLAVDEMLKSRSEHSDKNDPLVGAVLVSKEGKLLGSAHRGGLRVGNHAEFTLIERCLAGTNLEGATLYVTLEPCTQRNSPKTPCAEWIAKARIGRVVIGIPDPNPDILGRGIRYLQKQDIQLDFFEREFVRQITDANRDFIAYCENAKPASLSVEPPEGSSNKELETQIGVHLQSFAAPALQQYLGRRGMANLSIPSDDLWSYLEQCRYITRTEQGDRCQRSQGSCSLRQMRRISCRKLVFRSNQELAMIPGRWSLQVRWSLFVTRSRSFWAVRSDFLRYMKGWIGMKSRNIRSLRCAKQHLMQ